MNNFNRNNALKKIVLPFIEDGILRIILSNCIVLVSAASINTFELNDLLVDNLKVKNANNN